jgi:hypothetical protein
MINEFGFDVVALTKGPKHHFFGYYDIQTWDSTGKYVLALESDFDDRFPAPDDTVTIGMVEWETKEFHPLTNTHAWNLQQGCMLHWLPTESDRKIIYNDRDGDRFVAVVMDVFTGHKRILPRPVAGLSNDGSKAFSLNYARMRECRRVVGYAGVDALNIDSPHPADDGLFLLDLETGESDLLVSFAQAFELNPIDDLRERPMWFNHATVNTDDSRVSWHVCYSPAEGPRAGSRTSAFFLANLDGSDLTYLTPYYHVSHHDWLDAERLLVWTNMDGQGEAFYLLNVVTREFHAVARDEVTHDGHCSFTRDGRWLLSDTYPDAERMQTLSLWNMEEQRLATLGRFYARPNPVSAVPAEKSRSIVSPDDVRCDLHPRWDRRNRWISFDSVHEGTRQVYAVDAAPAVGS